MKVHNIHQRLSGSPEGIRYLLRFIQQMQDCRVVEESYLIHNRNSPYYRKYITVLMVEEDSDG